MVYQVIIKLDVELIIKMIGGHQFSNLSYGFGSIVNGVGYAKDKFYSDASLIGNSVNSFYTPTHPNSEDSYIPPIRPI